MYFYINLEHLEPILTGKKKKSFFFALLHLAEIT